MFTGRCVCVLYKLTVMGFTPVLCRLCKVIITILSNLQIIGKKKERRKSREIFVFAKEKIERNIAMKNDSYVFHESSPFVREFNGLFLRKAHGFNQSTLTIGSTSTGEFEFWP